MERVKRSLMDLPGLGNKFGGDFAGEGVGYVGQDGRGAAGNCQVPRDERLQAQ